MKIIILHGDYIKKSQERLDYFQGLAKKRGWEIKKIEANANLSVSEQLSAGLLFQDKTLFVLGDVKKLTPHDFVWIKKTGKELALTLVVYAPYFVSKSILSKFPKDVKIEEFKLPRIIFTFLDGLYPRNYKRTFTLFHELVQHQPVEFIFALVAKQIRDLYWAELESQSLPYPAWRVGKLKSQSAKFKVEKLKDLINKLAIIDIAAKTGKADLISSLDLLIVTSLE